MLTPVAPNGEKSIVSRLSDRRSAQANTDTVQEEKNQQAQKRSGQQTPGTIQLHPLEEAAPFMEAIQVRLTEIKSAADSFNNMIEHAKTTGDVERFMESRLRSDPSAWEEKASEIDSLFKKLKAFLPITM